MPNEFIPSKYQMIIFQVTNHSDFCIEPDLNLELPNGWEIIAKPEQFKLNPKEHKRLFYTVFLNSQAKSGKNRITFFFSNKGVEIERRIVNVNVKQNHNITLNLLNKPKYLKDNEEYIFKYLITNRGNMDENINLISSKGIIEGETDIVLPIDSTRFILVRQLFPKINATQTIISDLSINLKDSDSTLTKSFPITVYPNQNNKSKVFHTYPIVGDLFFNTIENKVISTSFFQYNLTGKGFLDRKENHYLEFISNGSNNSGIERFETINRHLLIYKFKNSKIQVGDFTFGLSRLLENIRLGRGVLISQDIGKLNFVGFYNNLLYYPSIKNQIGGSISLKTNQNFLLKLNTIYRSYQIKENNSFSISLMSNYSNKKSLFLKAEYATSFQNNKTGFGTFINGIYKIRKIQLASDMMYTGKDFQGYYNNSIFNASSMKLDINKHFSLSTQVNYNFINPMNDIIIMQVAPFNQSYTAAIQYIKNKSNNHKIAFSYRKNRDRSEIEKFNYSENSLKYSYKYSNKHFNCQLSGEIASTKNKMASDEYVNGISYNTIFNGNYLFNEKIRAGIFSDYSKSNRYTYESIDYFFYGASLYYNPSNKLNFNVNYRNNFPLEENYKTNSVFNLDFKYKLNERNAFSLVANFSQPLNSNDKDIFVTLKYNILLDVAISKDKNLGHLKGQIKSIDNDNVGNITLNVNEISAITNEKGEFEFNNLAPDKYFLTIDQLSYNRNYITLQSLPLEIQIKPQKTDSLIINFIKPSRISGKIIYEKTAQIQSKEFKNNLPQLILKLDNGVDHFYTQVDGNGEYNFSEIKPGEWKLSIETKGLLNKFEFIDNFKTFKIEEGTNLSINFLVKDKLRKINFKKSNVKL